MITAEKSIDTEKKALREKLYALRAGVDAEAGKLASRAILDHLRGLPLFTKAKGVHCFIALPGEVDTAPIFALCQSLGKATFVPVQVPGEGRLEMARWSPGDPLEEGPFGVMEPPPGARRRGAPGDLDLVLAPGLGFDRRGGRLGYGKGYYDGFLATLKASGFFPPVIGLAFAVQILPSVPTGPRDVPLDGLLSEAGFLAI